MTSGELTKKVQALAEELGERHRIVGHDMHYVKINEEHVLLIERTEKFVRAEKLTRVSYMASLDDTCRTISRSGKVETWDEIEAWTRAAVNAIGV